jgi:hypothetical protein
MRHGGWLGLGIRGLLVQGMLGLLVLLKGLRVTRGENKNCLVDHDTRDLILRLKVLDSNPPQYECCTYHMASLAHKFYVNLQEEDTHLDLNMEE